MHSHLQINSFQLKKIILKIRSIESLDQMTTETNLYFKYVRFLVFFPLKFQILHRKLNILPVKQIFNCFVTKCETLCKIQQQYFCLDKSDNIFPYFEIMHK